MINGWMQVVNSLFAVFIEHCFVKNYPLIINH